MNVEGKYHASFAKFGDDEDWNRRQVFGGDPTLYNEHRLFVTSQVDQEITFTTHTYKMKHYHGPCEPLAYKSIVVAGQKDASILMQVNPGSYSEEPRQIRAGETLEYLVYTKFSDEDPLPHDWSSTVWSDRQPVIITHADGLQSDSFNYIPSNVEVDEAPAGGSA